MLYIYMRSLLFMSWRFLTFDNLRHKIRFVSRICIYCNEWSSDPTNISASSFRTPCSVRDGPPVLETTLDINIILFTYPCSFNLSLYSILASSAFLLAACSFNKKSLRSSLSVVQTQNQLTISTNANAKMTLLFNPSPQPWCFTAPALYVNHLGECEKDHRAMEKKVINRTGACAAKWVSDTEGVWEMATRSERPTVKSRAASIAKGADGTSKVRTFGWLMVRRRN